MLTIFKNLAAHTRAAALNCLKNIVIFEGKINKLNKYIAQEIILKLFK